jgi:hypothetical protein
MGIQVAIHEEMRVLISVSDHKKRAQFAAILAEREMVTSVACGRCGQTCKRKQRNQRFCGTRCRVAAHRAHVRGRVDNDGTDLSGVITRAR